VWDDWINTGIPNSGFGNAGPRAVEGYSVSKGGVGNNVIIEKCVSPLEGNDAQFVSQSVPLEMEADRVYRISITMKNNGTTTWTRADNYKLGSQNPQDNTLWGMGRVLLESNESIALGHQKTFTFGIRAPSTPGTYNFQWRMVKEGGGWFGEKTPNLVIKVKEPQISERYVATLVFVWFRGMDYAGEVGQWIGPYPPLEGRNNWNGSVEMWEKQIKDIIDAGIDIAIVDVHERFLGEVENFIRAEKNLIDKGYKPPKISFNIDIINEGKTIDYSTTAGKQSLYNIIKSLYSNYFALMGSYGEGYLAKINGKAMLSLGFIIPKKESGFSDDTIRYIRNNFKRDFGYELYLGARTGRYELGFDQFWSASATENVVDWPEGVTIRPGQWAQWDVSGNYFEPRNGGITYQNAIKGALSLKNRKRFLYIWTWNEYSEGTGIYKGKTINHTLTDNHLKVGGHQSITSYFKNQIKGGNDVIEVVAHNDYWGEDPRLYIKKTAYVSAKWKGKSLPKPDIFSSADLWISPQPLLSEDYKKIFTEPWRWAEARKYVKVFSVGSGFLHPQWEQNWIGTHPEDAPKFFSDNELMNLFRKLNRWGIDYAWEVSVIKGSWQGTSGCTADVPFNMVKVPLQRIKSLGGQVKIMTMDEPYMGGTSIYPNGKTCNMNMDEVIDEVIRFINFVKAEDPSIVIGDIEPYPHFTKEELKQWIVRFKEKSGYEFPFFLLDVNLKAIYAWSNNDGAKIQEYLDGIRELQEFALLRGIKFGVIIICNNDWQGSCASSDQGFYAGAMRWAEILNSTLSRPLDIVKIQSWIEKPDYNVPDSAGYTFMQLVRDYSHKYNLRSYHKADTNKDGCIDMEELLAFIERWKVSSADVSIGEVVGAIGKWKKGC
jgi:hypothetical protein